MVSALLKIRCFALFLLLPAITLIGSGTVSAATKTLTIKGSVSDSGSTIQIPDTAQVNVQVADQGITITMPDLDLRLRCLPGTNDDGYCYVDVAAGPSGGAVLTADDDDDGDRVPDDWDLCPNTPITAPYTDNRGCADVDGDGIFTPEDVCPTQGGQVDSTGCQVPNAVTYTVTASAGNGGSIAPSGEQLVAEGGTASFTATASSGFSFNRFSGSCPSGTTSGTTYTTGAITGDCTVVAEFTANNTSGYCAGTPSSVICDPNAGAGNPGGTMDSWSDETWGFNDTPIPNGKVVAYPFLANGGASGAAGVMGFSNNMPDLAASGYLWKGWFSASPGGAVLNDNDSNCSNYSSDPNPINIQWSQAANPGNFDCNLGQTERVLYFNMTVACYADVFESDCTLGAPFPGFAGYPPNYYITGSPK